MKFIFFYSENSLGNIPTLFYCNWHYLRLNINKGRKCSVWIDFVLMLLLLMLLLLLLLLLFLLMFVSLLWPWLLLLITLYLAVVNKCFRWVFVLGCLGFAKSYSCPTQKLSLRMCCDVVSVDFLVIRNTGYSLKNWIPNYPLSVSWLSHIDVCVRIALFGVLILVACYKGVVSQQKDIAWE